MIAVLFLVELPSHAKVQYLQLAEPLAADLAKFDGFLSVQRFQSLSANTEDSQQLLSLSLWRDEAAVAAWRTQMQHQQAQQQGRTQLFRDYRILVTQVLRDYGMHQRTQAPVMG